MIHLERARAGDDRAFEPPEPSLNRQPAYTCFLNDQPAGIVVLTAGPDGITGITRFLPAHVVLNRT